MLKIELSMPEELSEEKLEQLIDLNIGFYDELHPEDPPRSRELIRDFLLNPHPLWNFCRWFVIDTNKDRIVGASVISYENQKSPQYDVKRNIADIFAIVGRDYRGQGLGSRLLDLIIAEAKKLKRRQLQGECSLEFSRTFLLKHGAIITSERKTQRLYLKDIDPNTLKDWRQNGAVLNPGVKLHTLRVIHEDILKGYVNLYNETVQQTPEFDSGHAMPVLTSAEDRRETEKLVSEKNITWITIISEQASGQLSGFTEIFQRAAEPFVVEQGMTGVLKEHRKRGLGKWLKAEAVDYITKNLKRAGCIETGNANANSAMISINKRLGFQDYLPHAIFSLKI